MGCKRFNEHWNARKSEIKESPLFSSTLSYNKILHESQFLFPDFPFLFFFFFLFLSFLHRIYRVQPLAQNHMLINALTIRISNHKNHPCLIAFGQTFKQLFNSLHLENDCHEGSSRCSKTRAKISSNNTIQREI